MSLILYLASVFSLFQGKDDKDYVGLLASYWERFLNSLPQIVIALIVIIVFFIIAGLAGRTLKRNLLKRMEDQLLPVFLGRILRWTIILIGLFIAVNVLGYGGVASGLLAGLGASALIVGFAFKDIGENFLAGVILAFNRPFDIGDVIVSQDYTGTVKEVDMRVTTIKTFDGNDVFIPNSMIIKNPVLNYTMEPTRRHEFIVGVEYASDLGKAVQAVRSVLQDNKEVLDDPAPDVILNDFGSSSINIMVRFWVNNGYLTRSQFDVKSDVIKEVKEKFDAEGIDIPFDILQLQIHDKNQPIPLDVTKKESKK
ncbi:MAG: mechanosensitive ion channel family protein [Ignavibacteriae bacterium]|nr:mechanosensitive ion channel family protein [Ignavibacteriota bacterium]MCB9243503.1 mechanosensitive ion channel family protein [Ignavibacteriales bacterium]